MKCSEIIAGIRNLCPEEFAEGWDNVGLLVGDADREVKKILLALDATDEAVKEASLCGADMLVTHHPMIFSPVKRVVASDMIGRRIISLIENRISYYAMHTNFDVCCMADEAAGMIGMHNGEPLAVTAQRDGESVGIGKVADFEEMTLAGWAEKIKEVFGLEHIMAYGDVDAKVNRVAISPGSGKSMIADALEKNAGLLITGDIGHHEAIDAVAQGLCIIDAGHYGLEHIFMEYMKGYLQEHCGGVEVVTYAAGCPGRII